jgi:hypothetical protein
MKTFNKNTAATKDSATCGAIRDAASRFPGVRAMRLLLAATLIIATLMLGACASSSSTTSPPINISLSSNWQFTMAPPPDGSFTGGLLGGFLLQTNGSVKGGTTYAVSLPGFLIPCNSGSATVTGTVSGQTVSLTAVAGTQTFMLTGAISLDSASMSGTYDSTDGTAGNGSSCGTAQTNLQWSAALVPPLTGPVQGTFHSAGGAAGLNEQDFLLTGALSQAPNTGANSELVTGSLSFLNPLTTLSDYPCLTSAYVYGEISGNAVDLQLVANDGSVIGQIGEPLGSNGVTGMNPVTYASVNSVYILNGGGPNYMVATSACPGSLGNINAAGDYGNICLALRVSTACQLPVTLTPSALFFASQTVGAPPTTQTIVLTNNAGVNLGSLTLALANNSGAVDFTESDTCGVNGVPSQGQPFSLGSGTSCEVTITFAPLQTCTQENPDQCLSATLIATSPANAAIVTVPITGTGVGAGPRAGVGGASVIRSEGKDLLPVQSTRKVGTLQNVGHHAGI